MIELSRNGTPYLRFKNLSEFGFVEHAILSRIGGTSSSPYDTLNLSTSVPDLETNVFANRARAYATLGRHNDSLVHAILTHGADVAQVSHQDHGLLATPADGLITNDPGCGLTMNYADCAPLLLYDSANHVAGLGHAGWQGVVKDLPGAMVGAMKQFYGSNPADIVSGIGPCIGPCCYEVGERVISAVVDSFENSQGLLQDLRISRQSSSAELKRYFDLPEANRRRLLNAGVQNIELSGLCTACRTDLFFSHRAEKGRTGRFGTILILRKSL